MATSALPQSFVPRGRALRFLERRIDSFTWRGAARLVAIWRLSPLRRLPPLPPRRIPIAAGGPGTVESLARALADGALESAARLAEERVASGDWNELTGADACALLEALLMVGGREEAQAIARSLTARLNDSARGRTLLELLRLSNGDVWLVPERPNFLGLSRLLASGAMTASQLASGIPARLGLWLRWPELHLLFFNSLVDVSPARGARFLSRYLEQFGLPDCQWKEADDAVNAGLGGISFEAAPAISDGPLVSILVAARNARPTLALSLDSLLRQNYRRVEILVGDDASEDGSLPLLCDRYGTDPRVRLFASAVRQGTYNIRNGLARKARGSLLTFHDADDVALPTRIARQVAPLQTDGGCIASTANVLRISPEGHFVFFKDQSAARLAMVSLLVRREAFEASGGFRSAFFGADLELYEAIRARHGSQAVARIRAPLILGSWSPASVTRSLGSEALEDGYRSPGRRAYSQMVHDRYHHGVVLSDSEMDARLRLTGNFAARSELVEVTH